MGSAPKKRLGLRIANVNSHQIYTCPGRRFAMSALIYTRGAAQMIAPSISTITSPIDNMIFHNHAPFGLRVVEIRPSLVQHHDELGSDIGVRVGPQALSKKVRREFCRIRNSMKLWCSFVYTWGLSGVFGLRRIGN